MKLVQKGFCSIWIWGMKKVLPSQGLCTGLTWGWAPDTALTLGWPGAGHQTLPWHWADLGLGTRPCLDPDTALRLGWPETGHQTLPWHWVDLGLGTRHRLDTGLTWGWAPDTGLTWDWAPDTALTLGWPGAGHQTLPWHWASQDGGEPCLAQLWSRADHSEHSTVHHLLSGR